MPIPAFDSILNVLPPHLGDPRDPTHLSPYPCTMGDLCGRFADHFLVPLGSAPRVLVDLSKYWYGLFSHRRDRVWKGMLAVALADRSDDAAANSALGATP